jgi:hypothetical protein
MGRFDYRSHKKIPGIPRAESDGQARCENSTAIGPWLFDRRSCSAHASGKLFFANHDTPSDGPPPAVNLRFLGIAFHRQLNGHKRELVVKDCDGPSAGFRRKPVVFFRWPLAFPRVCHPEPGGLVLANRSEGSALEPRTDGMFSVAVLFRGDDEWLEKKETKKEIKK